MKAEKLTNLFMLTNLAAFIQIEQLDRKMCHKQKPEAC